MVGLALCSAVGSSGGVVLWGSSGGVVWCV